MPLEPATTAIILVILFVVVGWWLIGNAIERREQRKAAAAAQAEHANRVDNMESLAEDLVHRFGPLSSEEHALLWKIMLGSMAVDGRVELSEVGNYVSLVRQLTKASAESSLTEAPSSVQPPSDPVIAP